MAESAFRVTTYEFRNDEGTFGGTLYDLTLQQDLAEDYFVMIFSAGAGGGGSSGSRGPDENFARITRDPNGTGDLTASSGSDVIRLERFGDNGAWQGSVIVVESLGGPKDPNGFRLRAVKTITMLELAVSSSASLTGDQIWDDVDQCTAHWGHAGGGVEVDDTATSAHPQGLAYLELIDVEGSELIRIHKDGGGQQGDADHVCYLIEWGAAWTVTSLEGEASNGGIDVDATGEWNTVSIGATVTRASTFIFCGGNADDNSVGQGALGTVYALGNGITESATETVVAFAAEYAVSRRVRIFVMEHDDVAVDYRSPDIPVGDAAGSQTVDAAGGTETYDNSTTGLRWTKGTRMPMHWGTCQATGNAFPRNFLSARHTSSTNVDWKRSRQGLVGKSRLISVDLDAIERLVLRPDPAIVTASGPAADVSLLLPQTPAIVRAIPSVGFNLPHPLSFLLPQAPAVATASSPAVGLALKLHPDPAIATASSPTVGLALKLHPDPAVATGSSPAVVLALKLHPDPAILSAGAPAVTVDLGAAGITLTPGPAIAEATVDIRGHPPSFLYSQAPAVAAASSPSLALSLLLPQAPAVASASAPAVGLALKLHPDPAVAAASSPASGLALVFPQPPAILTAAAPVLVAMADLVLVPAPAIVAAAAPAVVIVRPEITLTPLPASLLVLVKSPLLDLPGIEAVEFDLAICRQPNPTLVLALQLEFINQITRTPARTLVPARQLELTLAVQREVLHSPER